MNNFRRSAAVFFLSACATAGVAANSVLEKIQQLERQLNDALSKVDAAAVDKLWADDFVFVSPSGRIANKRQRLAGLKPADPNAPALVSTLDDVQVRVFGSVAIAIVKTTWRGTIEGKAIVDPYVATHVWVRTGSTWRLSSAQVAQVDSRQ